MISDRRYFLPRGMGIRPPDGVRIYGLNERGANLTEPRVTMGESSALHGLIRCARPALPGLASLRRRDIKEHDAFVFAAQVTVGHREQAHPELGVVAGIRAGVILSNVETTVADAAHRAPVKTTEVDNQVGSYLADLAIDLLGLEDQGAARPALVIAEGLAAKFGSGAEVGTRTLTPLRALDPESSASANSATSA